MEIIKKIKQLPNLYTYFYQPHVEYSYYLLKKNNNDFFSILDNKILKNKINFSYESVISNLTEDIYYINKNDNLTNFQSIRLRTYLDGDYKYSANMIFAFKNYDIEDIYVTVHKNITNLDDFIKNLEIYLFRLFGVKKFFYIKKYKKVFFIKNFVFKDHKIIEDYLSFAFEEIYHVYDVNHKIINNKFFPSNYILEIEYSGEKCANKAYEIKKELMRLLCNDFKIIKKKHRKSFDIIKNLL